VTDCCISVISIAHLCDAIAWCHKCVKRIRQGHQFASDIIQRHVSREELSAMIVDTGQRRIIVDSIYGETAANAVAVTGNKAANNIAMVSQTIIPYFTRNCW
jgi:hypothetical protein